MCTHPIYYVVCWCTGALVLMYTSYKLLRILVHWCMCTHPVYCVVDWCMCAHPVYCVVDWCTGAYVQIMCIVLYYALVHVYTYIVLYADVLVQLYTSYLLCCMLVHWCMCTQYIYILCCMLVHWCMCTHPMYCILWWCTGACVHIIYIVL